MRRFFPALAVLGIALLGACTDADPSKANLPTAPGLRGSLQAPTETEIRSMIAQLLANDAGLRNAASAQFNNVVKSKDAGKLSVAQNQAGALINFLQKHSAEGRITAPTSDVFGVGSIPTASQGLSQLIAALYRFLGTSGLSQIDAAAEFVPVGGSSSGDIVVKTGTGLAAVRIPTGALGVDALVTITPIAYSGFAPGAGPLFTPKNGSIPQYPFFYEVSAYPVGAGAIATPFNSAVTVEVCQIETGPYAPPEAIHPRLRLAHNVGTALEILDRVSAPDLVCVPPSLGSLDRPMESEGWLARGSWELRTLPSRLAEAVTPASAFAAHGGLGGLTTSFSPFGAVDVADPQTLGFATDPASDATCPVIQTAVLPCPEFTSTSASVDATDLHLSFQFAPGRYVASQSLIYVTLDMDEDPATGFRGLTSGGALDATLIGGEYFVSFGPSTTNATVTHAVCPTPNLVPTEGDPLASCTFTNVGTASAVLTTDGVNITVPRSLIQDSDGKLNYKASSEKQPSAGIVDVISDVGLAPIKVTTAPIIQ